MNHEPPRPPSPETSSLFFGSFATLPESPYRSAVDLGRFSCLLLHVEEEGDYSKHDVPLALGYAASIVRMNGGRAAVAGIPADHPRPEAFAGYDLIALYPLAAVLPKALTLLRRIKDAVPRARTCFFNSDQHQHEMILGTLGAWEFGRSLMLQEQGLDFILVGQAEESFLRLCEQIASGQDNWKDIPGCIYRDGGRVMAASAPPAPADFAFLPFPSRDHLEASPREDGVNPLPIRVQSSRGCVSSCLYCVESSANRLAGTSRKPWSGRGVERFIDEVEMLHREYDATFFNVSDSSFEDPGTLGLERMARFCDEITRRKLEVSFKIHLRVETVGKLDDAFLRALKRAGVDILVLGVESGLPEELASYRKIATADQSIANIKRLDRFGLFFPLLGHMMFSPTTRLEHLRPKIAFIEDLARTWDYLDMSNNLLVFSGTAYHQFLRKEGLDLPCDPISAVIPYRHADERVQPVADAMGDLKRRCPQVIPLHQLLYDACNIMARYTNPMNAPLRRCEAAFQEFRGAMEAVKREVGAAYSGYLSALVELAERGWSGPEAERRRHICVAGLLPSLLERTEDAISRMLEECRRHGISTARLHMKTWMSLINTRHNTAGGEVS